MVLKGYRKCNSLLLRSWGCLTQCPSSLPSSPGGLSAVSGSTVASLDRPQLPPLGLDGQDGREREGGRTRGDWDERKPSHHRSYSSEEEENREIDLPDHQI
jgi:hypothetical protein